MEWSTGFFVFSLDTELAWGHFDADRATHRRVAARERAAVPRLLEILDEFGVVATWGVVGHLFYPECQRCDWCPIREWEGRYPAFEAALAGGSDWYDLECWDRLLSPASPHEIAFHGYTHRIFGTSVSAEEARREIVEWSRAIGPGRPAPVSVIFPRNRVACLEVFAEAGFRAFRGPLLRPAWAAVPALGRLLAKLDDYVQFAEPVGYRPERGPFGLVDLPASRRLLGVDPRVQRVLGRLGLGDWPLRRLLGGIESAARHRRVVHLVSHPYEFETEADFQRLRSVLRRVAELVRAGTLRSAGMAGLADLVAGPRPAQSQLSNLVRI